MYLATLPACAKEGKRRVFKRVNGVLREMHLGLPLRGLTTHDKTFGNGATGITEDASELGKAIEANLKKGMKPDKAYKKAFDDTVCGGDSTWRKAPGIKISHRPLHKCSNCSKHEKRERKAFKCCGKCKKAFYCSKKCQISDWKVHKHKCKHAFELSMS